jgi:hypothetical protein
MNVNFSSPQELNTFLIDRGIQPNKWPNKTIENLFQELKEGESRIEITDNGKLLRSVNVVSVRLSHGNDILIEEKQVFKKDGKERKRNGMYVDEKMKSNESPAETALRGIQEELGLKVETLRQKIIGQEPQLEEEITENSFSYPGLQGCYRKYIYKAELDQDQYDPKGYIEYQNDKTSYFVWKTQNQ